MKTAVLSALFSIMVLLAPNAAYAQSDGWLVHSALAAYLTLQGADLSVTEYKLGGHPPGLKESNPILAPFVDHPVAAGAFKMGVAASTSWMLLHYHEKHPRLVFWCAIASDGFYVWVVAHNARLTRGL